MHYHPDEGLVEFELGGREITIVEGERAVLEAAGETWWLNQFFRGGGSDGLSPSMDAWEPISLSADIGFYSGPGFHGEVFAVKLPEDEVDLPQMAAWLKFSGHTAQLYDHDCGQWTLHLGWQAPDWLQVVIGSTNGAFAYQAEYVQIFTTKRTIVWNPVPSPRMTVWVRTKLYMEEELQRRREGKEKAE